MSSPARPASGMTRSEKARPFTVAVRAVVGPRLSLQAVVAASDTDINTVVAVNPEGEIVSPCGMCRELVSDYSHTKAVVRRPLCAGIHCHARLGAHS